MKKTILPFLGMLLILLGVTSCTPTKQEKITITISANAVGPFFAGPNDLIADYQVDLANLINEKALTKEDIKAIKVESITLTLPDEMAANQFASATVQLVADDVSMTSIGVLNPIESESNSVTLTASKEADLEAFFKQDQFSVVVGWDFTEDDYSDELGTEVELTLNVEYK